MINADKLFETHLKFLVYTFKMQLLNVNRQGMKCESDTEICVFIPLKVSLHLNGINESILKVVKDLFGWCDSHF